MKEHTKWEDEMYQKYLLYCGKDGTSVLDYEQFDSFELLISYEDGHKELFNMLDQGYRWIVPAGRDILKMGEHKYKMEFSLKLRSKMQNAGLTCERLSEISGISRPSLSGYLNGKRLPGLYSAIKLAHALGCDVNEFLRIPK